MNQSVKSRSIPIKRLDRESDGSKKADTVRMEPATALKIFEKCFNDKLGNPPMMSGLKLGKVIG